MIGTNVGCTGCHPQYLLVSVGTGVDDALGLVNRHVSISSLCLNSPITYTHTHIYTHIHTYIHTYTYIYTHTHIYAILVHVQLHVTGYTLTWFLDVT